MRKLLFVIAISVFSLKCNKPRLGRDFFKDLKGYPAFAKEQLPVYGFDSLVIDSLSTLIADNNYWYLNTSSNALLNINGYIRSSGKIVYIRSGDKAESKSNDEQILFDFSDDSSKSWVIQYKRNDVEQKITVAKSAWFFNQLVQDSVVIFKAVHENRNSSFSREFLIQASLEKGLVSFIYLDAAERKIYTIDYLPSARIIYERVKSPIYQVQ